MNTIDQRILIPASQSVVWGILSDLGHSSGWHSDWQQVSFLTTKREGRATRFRCRTAKGKEQVVEITAWYNGLGYEYTLIDGSPFKSNVGRIRLQEIPEGTIVQWTFQYDGGRSAGKQLDKSIETSLKALYKQVTAVSKDGSSAKSLLKDGLPQEARSQYQPRHPSAPPSTPPAPPSETFSFDFDFDEPPVSSDDAQIYRPPTLAEPPVANDDTRPRPAIAASPLAAAPDSPAAPQTAPFQPPPLPIPEDYAGEPDFLEDLEADGSPRPVDTAALIPPTFDFDFDDEPDTFGQPPTPPIADPAPLAVAVPEPPAPVTPAPVTEPPPSAASTVPPEAAKSIWEIFGVQKPIAPPLVTPAATEPEPETVDEPAAEKPDADPVVLPLKLTEPPRAAGDTQPEQAVNPADTSPKPLAGLLEALAALNTTPPRPPRKGGHRARARLTLVRVRRPQ